MRQSFLSKDQKTEKVVKNLIWISFLIVGLLASLGAIKGASYLIVYFQRARVVDSAINLVTPRTAEAGRLIWLEDNPNSPKALEPFVRDQLTNDYRRAFEELTYSFLTGETLGLKTYFSDAALADVEFAMSSGVQQKFIDWDHKLTLNFYSPDGTVIALEDDYSYAQGSLAEDDLELPRIARRKLDVVLELKEGIWQISQWQVKSDLEVPDSELIFPNLVQDIRNIKGMNYIARSAPFNDLWPNLNLVELNADFATINRLGFNTIRIFLPYPSPEGLENFNQVLDIAATYDLNVIPTLLDTYTCYCLEDLPAVMTQFSDLYEALRHPNVILIDVKNEADRDFEQAGLNRTRVFLSYAINTLRRETGKPVIVGLIEPDPVLASVADVISLHHYKSPEELESRIVNAQSFNKPILLEEFGFHSWGLKLPDPHTEKEQAYYYQRVIDLATNYNVGWMAWTLHDLKEGDMPGGRTVERHLGILKADGQPKEVIKVIQGERVNAPTVVDKVIKFRYAIVILLIAFIVLSFVIWRFKALKRLKHFISNAVPNIKKA